MSEQKSLLIYGVGDLADLAYAFFTEDAGRTIAGFVLDAEFISEQKHSGLPVIDAATLEDTHPPDKFDLFIAVGYKSLNTFRARIYEDMKSRGYVLPSFIHSTAVVPHDLVIGENCMVMEGVVIQKFAQLANNIIVWSGSLISHHVALGDHCFLSAHVVISGHCTIGSYSFIGVNATIGDKLNLAPKTLVGAGALLLADTGENQSYLGSASESSGIPSDRLASLL